MTERTKLSSKITQIIQSLPQELTLCAAVKYRTVAEIEMAYRSGIKQMGMNYIQEGVEKIPQIKAKDIIWSYIGYLQSNKAKQCLKYFDQLETLHSLKLAKMLDQLLEIQETTTQNSPYPIMVQINSAEEEQKNGILPEESKGFFKQLREFKNLRLIGVMTMGAAKENLEDLRPYFKLTKEIFTALKQTGDYPFLQYLSMGMSDSYQIAIEEGANYIRLGTALFGPRYGK